MDKQFIHVGVVIPVREGSSRIKEKALLPFGEEGISLLEWKIIQVSQVISKKNIYVSTESQRLKDIALRLGVCIHNRDFYLADGHKATFSEVITGIVKEIPFKYVAWVTIVVPLMTPQEYRRAFELFYTHVVQGKKYDSLASFNLLKEYLWNEHESLNYQADMNHTISQDLPNIYRITNALYMRDRESILRERYFLGKNPYKFTVSKM